MEKENNLARLRERCEMTQQEVAEELGITRQAVSQWESGRAFPSMEKQIALSRLYGISVEELYRVDGAGVRPESKDMPERKRPQKKIISAAVLIGVYLSVYLWGVLTHSVTLATNFLIFITLAIMMGCILYILITKIVQSRKGQEK